MSQTDKQMRFYCGSCDFFVDLGPTDPRGECHFFPVEAVGEGKLGYFPKVNPRVYACSKHQGYGGGKEER